MELPPEDEGIEIGEGRWRLRAMARYLKRPLADEGLESLPCPDDYRGLKSPSQTAAAEASLEPLSPRTEKNAVARLPSGPDCSCGYCAEKVARDSFRTLQCTRC